LCQTLLLRDKLIDWSLFIVLCLVWGSSFLLMKIGMESLSPYQVATIRILSAGLVLIPFAAKAFQQVPKKKLGLVILSGLLGNFFPAYLFCLAETKIDSSFSGMLNSFTPLFTAIIGILFFQMKAGFKKIAGVVVGLIGLCLLVAPGGSIGLTYFSYVVLIIIATIFYAVNVNMVGKYLQGLGSLNIAAVAFVCLVIPCLVILFCTGYFSLRMSQPMLVSTGASCVLGIMGTAVATVLYYILVKRAGALFASMVTYGIPFVALLWGVLYGEHITLFEVACLGIMLVGVYLSGKK